MIREVTFPSGSTERAELTWPQVLAAGNHLDSLDNDLADWMVNPRKSWPHPQDPITFKVEVTAGREADARAWLDELRQWAGIVR
jgi:hypothetical protein